MKNHDLYFGTFHIGYSEANGYYVVDMEAGNGWNAHYIRPDGTTDPCCLDGWHDSVSDALRTIATYLELCD